MVKLTKIYTRTGDDGTTGLADGTRRSKHDLRIACYGTIDEANAALGLARAMLDGGSAPFDKASDILSEIVMRLQNDYFDLGADLATPDPEMEGALRVTDVQVTRLESEIDLLNNELDALESFILPGGTLAAGYLHLARTITRRAERELCAAIEAGDSAISPEARQFVNRASDLLFVAARAANNNGKSDILWQPGLNR